MNQFLVLFFLVFNFAFIDTACQPDTSDKQTIQVIYGKPDFNKLTNIISENDARSLVELLTHPVLEGRFANSEEFDFAARFTERELKLLGYKPVFKDTASLLNNFRYRNVIYDYDPEKDNYANPRTVYQKSNNVIGWIPGTTNEIVVISAHLDHVGRDMKTGAYFPGADDNASGTAAVLQIARAFSSIHKTGYRLRRGVVIALWGAEELGLFGSRDFVKNIENGNLPFKMENIVLVVNLDMVGRKFEHDSQLKDGPKSVLIVGADEVSTARDLQEKNPILIDNLDKIIATTDPSMSLLFDDGGKHFFRRTDTFSFVSAKPDVATIFFTGPEHKDYHAITDTAEKLDYNRLARIAKIAFLLSANFADSDLTPRCADCFVPKE
ncbi:MAG: M20/M25/M40 family metallo-hydrolase [Candidatus Yanofskybacteria bacterium]|nr:M20/M25/M40 family metallo-hydrolase [Candidatus Yanofskybacteria bacterium]